jgi:serine/threonine protein kinase
MFNTHAPYTTLVDIWSFGVMTWEMLFGMHTYYDNRQKCELKFVFRRSGFRTLLRICAARSIHADLIFLPSAFANRAIFGPPPLPSNNVSDEAKQFLLSALSKLSHSLFNCLTQKLICSIFQSFYLALDPSKRPSALSLLNHPFLGKATDRREGSPH